MTCIHKLTIAKALNLIKSKKLSSSELIKDCIKNIKAYSDLNAIITDTSELALEKSKSTNNGLLEGIPLTIKDNFCTNGIRTTAGSKILDNFVPNYESFITQKLLSEGALFLGKANMDEFAMGSSNETSYFGPVKNIYTKNNKPTVPGGSSGGSAVSVATSMALGSLGSDTGGSVRQPASYTGLVGLKPTYGRCSRWGMISYASSLDQAGIITKTVEDAAILLQVIAGFDSNDSTSKNISVPDYRTEMKTDRKYKIGVPRIKSQLPVDVLSLLGKSIKAYEKLGYEVVDIDLPNLDYALPTYYIIALAEASSNLARYDGVRYGYRNNNASSIDELYEMSRSAGFGDEVKRRILLGNYVLSSGYYDAYYSKAQKLRTLIYRDFKEAFEKVDSIMVPTTPTDAFCIGEQITDPATMYLNDIFTVPVNLAGLPAISIPCGLSLNNLPLGIQLIGKKFDESNLLAMAEKLEREFDFLKLGD